MGTLKLTSKGLYSRFKEYADIILEGGLILDDENKPALNASIDVFKKNSNGLMVIGNPGSGKTLLFEIIQRITNPEHETFFKKINVLDVVLQFNDKSIGHNVFQKWNKQNILFDDLGTEKKGYLFGEKTEVFEIFIQFRYELFRSQKIKTHFTTNLSYTELKERYGARCVSRLNEMCTVVMLGNSINYSDRRKLKNFIGLPAVHYESALAKEVEEVKEIYKAMQIIALEQPAVVNGIGSKLRQSLGT